MKRGRWRCFHCDAVFTRDVDAAEHFGETQGSMTGCQIKGHEHRLLGVIRLQENELARYRSEDGEIMRAMAEMGSEHGEAVRQAEDKGYDRGVRDMQSLAVKQFGQRVSL